MNTHERRVLQRKRAIIADTLNFSPRAQKIYRQHGMLTDVMTGNIMVNQSDVCVSLLLCKYNECVRACVYVNVCMYVYM